MNSARSIPLALFVTAAFVFAACGDDGSKAPEAIPAGSQAVAAAASDGGSNTPAPDALGSFDAVQPNLETSVVTSNRGFPDKGPWVSFYGPADGLDLPKIAATFRVINVDADPGAENFTPAQIAELRANGKNRVISYLNIGSCENYRTYWSACVATGALTTEYDGYPDEKWADLSNVGYQDLMVNEVAQALADRGVDGFFLDNLEVIEHGAGSNNGPCDASCSQGGLDLVWKLRQRFPDKLIVMQNATSDITREGTTHGAMFRTLLDGISHEEVYSNGGDDDARDEMIAWRDLGLTVSGRPFWLAVEEYTGACSLGTKSEATDMRTAAQTDGLSAYVTDESGSQQEPCYTLNF